jgi:hypothetical protein
MADRRYLKKLIKSEFKGFLAEQGFFAKTDKFFLRITPENVLHMVLFEFLSNGFTCVVAMIPLYVFEHERIGMHIGFGERLTRFRTMENDWFSYNEPDKGVARFKELLIQNGLPWFDEYGSPAGIADFISKGRAIEYGLFHFRYNAYLKKKYLGFSLLYTGRIDEGIRQLGDMLDIITEKAEDWMREYKADVIQILDRRKEKPKDARKILDDVAAQNRAKLKI